ncbi:hypothetical protein F2P79_004401 [Pimephales promelas]|nr:hypothetical protein F2P79_004401 [Pimephales promelas]
MPGIDFMGTEDRSIPTQVAVMRGQERSLTLQYLISQLAPKVSAGDGRSQAGERITSSGLQYGTSLRVKPAGKCLLASSSEREGMTMTS